MLEPASAEVDQQRRQHQSEQENDPRPEPARPTSQHRCHIGPAACASQELLRDHRHHEQDGEREQHEVIEIAKGRDRIGDEIERIESIGGDANR